MQVNYDAISVVWEPVDTRPSGRHSWLQIFSTHFSSGIGYLLSLTTILIPRKFQQTNTCSNSTKDILEQGVNYSQSWQENRTMSLRSGFLSRTLTTYRTAGEGRRPSFIPLYHFHPLTNIQTFTCNFACEMTITYFYSHRLYLPDCYSMRFTTLSNYHVIDWWCDIKFLFAYLIIWF